MKKSYILLLIAISIVNVNAEEKFSFQFNPLLFLGINFGGNIAKNITFTFDKESKPTDTGDPYFLFDVEFQYAINGKFALFINPSFSNSYGGHTIYDSNNDATFYRNSGLNLGTGLLYYPYGTGLKGMYVGIFPIIGWGYITKNGKIIRDFLNIGSMAEVGYEWILKKGFTITLGTGICKIYQIPSASVFAPEINEVIEYVDFYGVNLGGLPFDARMRFSIGYSF
jgi:hypothetical protein